MADKINFTQDKIRRIPPSPSGERKTYYDTGCPGLTARVTEKGVKTFVLQKKIRGRARKIRLGYFTGGTERIDVREARNRAITELSKISNGIDWTCPSFIDTQRPLLEARSNASGLTLLTENTLSTGKPSRMGLLVGTGPLHTC